MIVLVVVLVIVWVVVLVIVGVVVLMTVLSGVMALVLPPGSHVRVNIAIRQLLSTLWCTPWAYLVKLR